MIAIKRLLLAAALLLGFGPAHATTTILTSCTEDISCILQGTVGVSTTAGTFNSSNARLSLTVSNTSVTTFPSSNRIQTNTFSSASSDFWLSANYHLSNIGTSSGAIFITFVDGGTGRLILRGTGTNQQVKLTTRNAAGTLTDLVTASGSLCAVSTRCKLDIHVVYGTSGSVNVYNSGTLILTYSGDVTTNSATTLNQVDFSGAMVNGSTASWSEMFASDSDTRNMVSVTCAPLAAGATQNWTGSAGNINANSYNDATFNYTTTNNDLSQWTTGCTIPSLSAVVDVRSYGRLAIGASGPQNSRFSLHISGSDYDNGSDLAGITTSFANIKYDWGATSPASGIAWTQSELTSSFSFGVKSRP